ncbi:MAG: DUF3047 domain-containing protein [Spirochaetes bacterium]|nr:DUF3047 domain-containing protein [Spirochaetota bacterium]
MKKSVIIFFIIILFSGISVNRAEQQSQIIEDFEEYSNTDDLFRKWLLRDGKKEASKMYSIQKLNNNKYLKADSSSNSIQIAKKVNWDLKFFPLLSWRWQTVKIPINAKENARGRNDSGAAVYVVFQRAKLPFLSWKYQPVNVIKYIWSTTLPEGTVVKKDKQKLGKTIYEGRFIVLESGEENLGKWITEERNVLKDYKQVFGKSPEDNPVLIAILSDSNDTGSFAVAAYDDIIIKKEE